MTTARRGQAILPRGSNQLSAAKGEREMKTEVKTQALETYRKMCEEARKVNYGFEVMIEYESRLAKITPDMAFWWWDNMGPIERYRLWSPDHVGFEWEIDPAAHGRVGAIHNVTEYVGDILIYLRLRYEDPADYPGSRSHKHAIVESSLTPDDRIMGWILHEFDQAGNGLVMRNVFHLPIGTPKEMVNGIVEHSNKEMETLPKFLPALYAKSTKERVNLLSK